MPVRRLPTLHPDRSLAKRYRKGRDLRRQRPLRTGAWRQSAAGKIRWAALPARTGQQMIPTNRHARARLRMGKISAQSFAGQQLHRSDMAPPRQPGQWRLGQLHRHPGAINSIWCGEDPGRQQTVFAGRREVWRERGIPAGHDYSSFWHVGDGIVLAQTTNCRTELTI